MVRIPLDPSSSNSGSYSSGYCSRACLALRAVLSAIAPPSTFDRRDRRTRSGCLYDAERSDAVAGGGQSVDLTFKKHKLPKSHPAPRKPP